MMYVFFSDENGPKWFQKFRASKDWIFYKQGARPSKNKQLRLLKNKGVGISANAGHLLGRVCALYILFVSGLHIHICISVMCELCERVARLTGDLQDFISKS